MDRKLEAAGDLLVLGGGGHTKVILETLQIYEKSYSVAGIIEKDESAVGTQVMGIQVIGTDDDLKGLYLKGIRKAFVGIGMIKDCSKRLEIISRLEGLGFEFINVVHGSSIISPGAETGIGNAILAGTIINVHAVIGNHCIINTGSIIEHDCRIGDNTHIAPGVCVSGGAQIGRNCLIGAGAVIIQGITIGDNCIVGAGSVVIRDIPDNSTFAGVPAKRIR